VEAPDTVTLGAELSDGNGSPLADPEERWPALVDRDALAPDGDIQAELVPNFSGTRFLHERRSFSMSRRTVVGTAARLEAHPARRRSGASSTGSASLLFSCAIEVSDR
jgi:hypothetical protein